LAWLTRETDMRALELTRPFGIENLRVVEREIPQPGIGEVLVKIAAASLNFRDLMMVRTGGGARDGNLPITPLSDACGHIAAIGPGVSGLAVGDRVCSLFFQEWLDGAPDKHKLRSSLAMPVPGVGAEYAILNAHGVAKIPAFLTDAEGATLPCAALTAWRAVVEESQVKPGGTVVLLGTGGVSIFALQFAILAGYRTIITSSSDDKLELCRSMGAHQMINYRQVPQWGREVRRLTGGVGADLVVEVGGPGTIQQSLQATRIGGDVVIVGGLAQSAENFSVSQLIPTGVNLKGINVGSGAMFKDMCRAIEFAQVRPVIGSRHQWPDAKPAFGAIESGDYIGKVVLEFTDSASIRER
jgi:NADPH:quinone reductase-like Zn-dependent oxidoreductase